MGIWQGAVEDLAVKSSRSPSPDFWRDKRVLVTGHTGFKGSWLVIWLNRLGAEVVADRCIVALPCGLADLPVRYGEHPVLGVEALGGLQYCVLRTTGPIGAHGPCGGHLASQRRPAA